MKQVVITHPEQGIYVGHALGLGFWSLLDAAGQNCAVTFDSRTQAADHIRSWDSGNNPADYDFAPVEVSQDHYANVPELKAAGLGHLLGEMDPSPVSPGEKVEQREQDQKLNRPVYGYYINLDERGEFYADVRDLAGNTVWEVHTGAAQELIEDGFVKDVRDPLEIGRYLIEDAGILPAGATVHPVEAFERLQVRANELARDPNRLYDEENLSSGPL